MMIFAIVAVDENWGIGNKGNLLFSIPEDMKRFRHITEGKTVIMGRKTFESLPGRKPLKNRKNIVITRDASYGEKYSGIDVVCSVEDALEKAKMEGKDICVIGGGLIYEQMLPYCEYAYITKVYRERESDTYFPNLDSKTEWEVKEKSGLHEYEEIGYEFFTYQKKA